MPAVAAADRETIGERQMKLCGSVLAILLALVLSAEAAAVETPNPLIGRNLYYSYCLVCHGTEGSGNGPIAKSMDIAPADLTSSTYQEQSLDDLAALIGGYRPEGSSPMPNWSVVLDKTDLLDLAAYVNSLGEGGLTLRGDTRRGRIIFRNSCVGCHGKSGNGRGLLAHLLHVEMTDYTQSEIVKQLSDDDLLDLIANGKGEFMPAWRGILTESEILDVASYVRMLAR